MKLSERFEMRVSELNSSLDALAKIEDDSSIDSPDRATNLKIAEVLRASLFLQSYNVIEATVRDCLVSTWDDIRSSTGAYHEVRSFWRRDFLHTRFSNLLATERGIKPVVAGIDRVFWSEQGRVILFTSDDDARRIRIGGNVGFDEVELLSKEIGLGVRIGREISSGRDLDIIKNKRNSLAHGEETFSDVGRDYTYQDIYRILNRGLEHIRKFVRAFERYQKDNRWKRSQRMKRDD